MPTAETLAYLRTLPTDKLRAVKLRTCEAKGNTYDHRLFTFVDQLLMLREVIRILTQGGVPCPSSP